MTPLSTLPAGLGQYLQRFQSQGSLGPWAERETLDGFSASAQLPADMAHIGSLIAQDQVNGGDGDGRPGFVQVEKDGWQESCEYLLDGPNLTAAVARQRRGDGPERLEAVQVDFHSEGSHIYYLNARGSLLTASRYDVGLQGELLGGYQEALLVDGGLK